MEGQIVDVEYECGLVEIAKIIEDNDDCYVVSHLAQTNDLRFRFSRFSYAIPKESVSGFYDTTELEDTGLFVKIDDMHYESIESDSEYDCDSDSDTETEVSLDDE